MVRSIVVVVALCFSVLLLPLWATAALFLVGLFVLPQKLLLFIPAVLSDALYAPREGFAPVLMFMTLSVAVLLIIDWLIRTQTRATQFFYGVAEK